MHKKKRLIKNGHSWVYLFDAGLIRSLEIDPKETTFAQRIEGDCVVIRPIGTRKELSVARRFKTYLDLLQELDDHGFSREHFARISPENITLGELRTKISCGIEPDLVTLARLKLCLERRKTCRELWDATITAVLARRTSTLHPTACDESDMPLEQAS